MTKAFQGLITNVADAVKAGSALPVSMTAVFAIHHNLVVYGIPIEYLAPKRTYYSPKQACTALKQSSLFKEDSKVQALPCENPAGPMPGQSLYQTRSLGQSL